MASRLNFGTGSIVNPFEGLQTAIGNISKEYLHREAIDREDKRLAAAEAKDQRNFDLQMARYKLEDDRYARKEQMLLDKETKATGGEQALGQIREIAKNVALTTPVGKGMLDQAVKARGGKEYDLNNESDRAEYQRIADLALPSVSRDVLQQAVSPFMAAYGVDAKNIATQLLATDTGRDFDSEAKSSREAAKEANDYAIRLAQLEKGVVRDEHGNLISTSSTSSTGSKSTDTSKAYSFSTKDRGIIPVIPYFDVATDDSTESKMTLGEAFLENTIRTTDKDKKFNQKTASEALHRYVTEKLAAPNTEWKADKDGKIEIGSWDALKGNKEFQNRVVALYNEVEAEKAQEALKRKGQSAFELPALQGGRSASELEQLAADNAATQFNREILSRYKTQQPSNDKLSAATTQPVTSTAPVSGVPSKEEALVVGTENKDQVTATPANTVTATTSREVPPSVDKTTLKPTEFALLANTPEMVALRDSKDPRDQQEYASRVRALLPTPGNNSWVNPPSIGANNVVAGPSNDLKNTSILKYDTKEDPSVLFDTRPKGVRNESVEANKSYNETVEATKSAQERFNALRLQNFNGSRAQEIDSIVKDFQSVVPNAYRQDILEGLQRNSYAYDVAKQREEATDVTSNTLLSIIPGLGQIKLADSARRKAGAVAESASKLAKEAGITDKTAEAFGKMFGVKGRLPTKEELQRAEALEKYGKDAVEEVAKSTRGTALREKNTEGFIENVLKSESKFLDRLKAATSEKQKLEKSLDYILRDPKSSAESKLAAQKALEKAEIEVENTRRILETLDTKNSVGRLDTVRREAVNKQADAYKDRLKFFEEEVDKVFGGK
jgi:hypothetical protein